jgi:hypothetical protein
MVHDQVVEPVQSPTLFFPPPFFRENDLIETDVDDALIWFYRVELLNTQYSFHSCLPFAQNESLSTAGSTFVH